MAGKRASGTGAVSTPVDNPCNLFFLRRAARAVSRQYAAAMKDSRLQATQFSVLYILSVSGALSITELANKMGMDRTSMSRNLIPLQTQNFISLDDEGAGRTREVTITAEGHSVLRKAMPMWRKAQAEFTEHMGETDTAALITLLSRVARLG